MKQSVAKLLILAALGGSLVRADDSIEPKGTLIKGAELATAIHDAGLDPQACFRVRDISFAREELRFYLTDGYLILGQPVKGRIYSAAFISGPESGDAEVIVIPPTRSERASLARFTETPNLDEHISAAVFIFSDDTGKELLEQIQAGAGKPALEKGALMGAEWADVVRNLSGSLATRLLHDSLSNDAPAGIFYSAATGRKLGNFDLIFDPQGRQQITVGQVVYRDERNFFDIWTSFTARAYRTGRKPFYRDGIVLSDYRIEAELQPPDLVMNAVTRMKLTVSAEVPGVVSLDLSQRMRVVSASIDGKPVEVLTRDSLRSDLLRGGGNGTALLVLDEPLQPGKTYELEVRHSGSVVLPAGNGVYFVGARTNWYPSHGTTFARYDMTFRYPRTVNLVANGDIGEDTVEGEWRITRRRTSGPIRFAGFNLGDYVEASTERAGCSIRVYANRQLESGLGHRPQVAARNVWPRDPRSTEILTMPSSLPTSPADRVQQLAQEIGGAYEFMVGHFGPGPLKTLTVSPIPGTFGQGFPGLVYLSTLSYMDPADRPAEARLELEQMFYSDILHSHETAHQWWGNLVTSASYEDDWLMESLANYSALMYLEKRKGRKALDSVLELYRTHLLQEVKDAGTVESAGPIGWGLRLNSSKLPGAWRIITYEKGSWILHMIRAQMGDEAFLKMLGQLAVRYRYQAISAAQFRQHAQGYMPPGFADRSLESFFDQWVYGTGVPKVSITAKWTGKPPAVKVRGTLSQQGVDEDFSTMIPVEIQLSNKRSITQWVRTASEPVEFTVPVKTAPSKVLLDPANNILRQ